MAQQKDKSPGVVERLLSDVTSGLVLGVIEVIITVSFGALIFSGELAPFVSNGAGYALYSSIIITLVVALFGSLKGTIASTQDSSSAILALVAASIAGSMAASATQEELFSTVLVALGLTALLTGVLFILLGVFKLGEFVRFIPYPVVGGFLAGTGWLLAVGAIGMMADLPMTFAGLPALFQPGVLLKWLPGVIFAVLLLMILRRYSHFLILPGMLVGAIALFYVVLLVTGTPFAEAQAQGLLLGPFPEGSAWKPITPAMLGQVNWPVIWGEAGNVATIGLVSLVSLLLNASGLELALEESVDLNRELRSTGLANVLSGLGGGIVGFPAMSLTALSYRVGGKGRLVGVIAAGVCGLALIMGASLISFFPKLLLGGLLLFLGLAFLVEWLVDAWSTLPRTDYMVVLLILVVISTLGFLEGVGVGIVATVILFIVNYSRIDVVKNALTGATYRSKVERPHHHYQVLCQAGEQIYVLNLQGFIFFGTANALLDRITARVNDAERPDLRFIVLDFRRVTGLDSSAVLSFTRVKQLAQTNHIVLIFTDLAPDVKRQLVKGGLDEEADILHIFPDLDYGVEWCEEQILKSATLDLGEPPSTLVAQLEEIFSQAVDVSRLMDYLERQELAGGTVLIRQGDQSEDLYFIESGQVTAQLEMEGGETIRLRTLGAGTVVGEVSLYLGETRSASVVTDEPGVAYRLSEEALKRMSERDPDLASAFHRFIAGLMAERLADNNRTLEALLD